MTVQYPKVDYAAAGASGALVLHETTIRLPYPWEDQRVRIYGYKSIGARVNLSKSAIARYADPEEWLYPLPVYEDPKGLFAYEDELTLWFARWRLPAGIPGALMKRKKSGTRSRARDSVRKRRAKDAIGGR